MKYNADLSREEKYITSINLLQLLYNLAMHLFFLQLLICLLVDENVLKHKVQQLVAQGQLLLVTQIVQ
jgi:hypothetical protein